MSVKFVNVDSIVSDIKRQIATETARLAQAVFTEVRKNTPVDTGLAKRGWSKRVTQNEFEVKNAVPYVPILDKGRHMTPKGMRGSKQAPRGIIGPSLDNIKRKN